MNIYAVNFGSDWYLASIGTSNDFSVVELPPDSPVWVHNDDGDYLADVGDEQACVKLTVSPETILVNEIFDELARARAKFPGDNVTLAALVEEVGELAKATFEEPRARVREEAVQVAVMAMRMVLDGDHVYEPWRYECGLDTLVEA